MTTTYWSPNAAAVAQVETATITAVANGGTVTATLNAKSVTYTMTGSDTTSTAAAAFAALLSAQSVPAEFQEVTFSASANAITCTANVAGTPFANVPGRAAGLLFSAAGGAAVTQAHAAANSSPSDVTNPLNWLRNGAPGLPQSGDDLVLSGSTTPLLWNLDQLAAVMLNSLTRWQSLEAQVGLPGLNATGGYAEWRATYLKFAAVGSGSSGAGAAVLLGAGQAGNGPPLEQYDFSGHAVTATALASGNPSGDYAVRLLAGPGATLLVSGTSAGVAMQPSETSAFANVTVDGGGSLALGPAVTVSGALSVKNGSAFLMCAPPAVTVQQGGSLTVNATAPTYNSLSALSGSSVAWLSGGTVTNLTLQGGSTFDKSADLRPMTVVSSAIDADCAVNDPNNCITWANPTAVRGPVTSGPFLTGDGRTARWA